MREYTQIAHAALVAKTGKNFAPCLRSIMPMWLMAMSDLHTPSSVAATNSASVELRAIVCWNLDL